MLLFKSPDLILIHYLRQLVKKRKLLLNSEIKVGLLNKSVSNSFYSQQF